jgi:diguanylate cyclase (GGDEF)-like protein
VALPGYAFVHDAPAFVATNVAATALLLASARQYWLARAEAPGAAIGLALLYTAAGLSFFLCAVMIVVEGRMIIGRAPDNWAENLNVVVGIAALAGIGALSLALSQARIAGSHRREARTDALTGLLNRRALFDLFPKDSIGLLTSVAVFDLDGFKEINDTYGHAVGDEVLRRFGTVLSDNVRETDVAARLGGDEFAVVLSRTSGIAAPDVAERIRQSFAGQAIETDRGLLTCTVSVGIGVGREAGQSFEDVLRGADEALYAAKRSGRDRVVAQKPRLVGGRGVDGARAG